MTMKDCEEGQQVKCEHRLTALETLIQRVVSNDLPHIQRWIIGVEATVILGMLGYALKMFFLGT